ncbi:MAG: hypothetical protein JRJ19_06490 [Deltaproteobacteria bacterium]|nr:hypothetical protein [Deltaproteobacteria bacterium]
MDKNLSTIGVRTKCIISLFLFGALFLSGCPSESGKESSKTSTRPALVSQAELKTLEDKALAEIEKYRQMKCPRPVLRGTAIAGSGNADMIAVIEGNSETADCRKLLEQKSEQLFEALNFEEKTAVAGRPLRGWREARPLDDPKASTDKILFLEGACSQAINLVRRAVKYEEACSPYLPGRRGEPALIIHIRTMRILAATARRYLMEGRTRECVELLLDGLRFGQDMSRGGSSLLEAMVSAAAGKVLYQVLELAFNQPKPIGEKYLETVSKELTQLIKTDVHPGTILRGEMWTMILYSVMPAVKGKDWVPPGGWGTEGRGPIAGEEQDNLAGKIFGANAKDDMAVAWLATLETGHEQLKACPIDKLPIECHNNLLELAKKMDVAADDHLDRINRIWNVAKAEDKIEEIRRQVIEILKGIAAPAYNKYIAKMGQARFLLAALKLQVEYRHLAEKTKSCPDAKAFDKEPLKSLRNDPYSGKPILIETPSAGSFVLRSPSLLDNEQTIDKQPAILVECPFRKIK